MAKAFLEFKIIRQLILTAMKPGRINQSTDDYDFLDRRQEHCIVLYGTRLLK